MGFLFEIVASILFEGALEDWSLFKGKPAKYLWLVKLVFAFSTLIYLFVLGIIGAVFLFSINYFRNVGPQFASLTLLLLFAFLLAFLLWRLPILIRNARFIFWDKKKQ